MEKHAKQGGKQKRSPIKPLQDKPYTPNQMPSLVDSKKQKLDVGRIVMIASYHTKAPVPPNMVAMSILLELQQPDTIHEQIGNTVFIAHPAKLEGKYVFRALNADTAANYVENAKQFIYLMRERGATELATQFSDKRLLRFIKMVAEDMLQDDGAPLGYRAFQNKNGEYLVAITLAENAA